MTVPCVVFDKFTAECIDGNRSYWVTLELAKRVELLGVPRVGDYLSLEANGYPRNESQEVTEVCWRTDVVIVSFENKTRYSYEWLTRDCIPIYAHEGWQLRLDIHSTSCTELFEGQDPMIDRDVIIRASPKDIFIGDIYQSNRGHDPLVFLLSCKEQEAYLKEAGVAFEVLARDNADLAIQFNLEGRR